MSGQPGTSAVRRWGELRPTPATRRPLIHSPTTSRPRDPHAVAETAPAMFAHTLTRCVPRLRPPPHRVRDPHAVAEPRAAPGLRTRPRASWCAAPPGDHDRLDRQSYRAELHQNCAKGGCTFRSRYLLSRQRNRTIRTVQVAEQFSGVPSAATPLRAGSTAKWSRLQTKISPRAPVRIMGAEWTQNGLGMISRLPIDNPGAWLCSGVEGRFPGTIRTRWGQRRPTLVLLTPSMYHFADRSSIQSSHHRRSGPISLSQKTFTWGAREGAFRMLTAVDFTPVSNSTEHILFRS